MRKFKFDEKVYKELALVGEGKLSFQIAKITDKSPSAESQRMNTFQKYGLISREKKGNITELRLTDSGVIKLARWASNQEKD
jgi:predicted transcriptional regulator